MSTEFKREERYVVFKLADLGNSLKGDEIRQLAREYAEQRRLKGKPPLECVVIESDWPEYGPTWKAIEARMTGSPEESAVQTAARIMNIELIRERDDLRARIEAMERQEPVAFALYSGWARKAVYLSEIEACEQRDRRQLTADLGGSLEAYRVAPLYLAPGAQPALSVPTALLVAVADLVAQMEIVSRVGFIDTPSDKDSCAAFCVAEGTWLELMSAVESLASALAAAPEAKPRP